MKKAFSFLFFSFLFITTFLFFPLFAHAATPGSWTFVGLSGMTLNSFAVDPTDTNILYAGTTGFGIFKSTDGGATWTAINNGFDPSTQSFFAIVIDPNNTNIIYAGGSPDANGGPGIYKSIDGGATWTVANNGVVDVGFGAPPGFVNKMIVDPTNSNILYVTLGVHCGAVYKSTDGAASWTRTGGGACDPIALQLDPTNSNIVYTSGGDGGVWKSTDAGVTWISNSSPATFTSLAIDPLNTTTLYASPHGGGAYKSMDGGLTWTNLNTPSGIYRGLITDPIRQDTVFLGQFFNGTNRVYISRDEGATWTDTVGGWPNIGARHLVRPLNDPNVLYALTDSGLYVYGIVDPVQRQLVGLNPAKVWVGLKNSDDVGVKFDLKAEVYKGNTLVTSGETDTVAAGSSGFNNAKQDTITFNSFTPVDFPAGSQLKLVLYVRNACAGSGHNSGVARLWYNDSQANSQFGATIGSNNNTYYLLNNFLLGTSAGSGPKATVDVQSGAKCSAFKPFGTWTITP